MLIRKFGTAFVALLLLLAAKSATANTLMCHSCTDIQMWAMATEHLYYIQTNGPYHIVDLDRGVIHKYTYRNNITPEFNPEFDPFEQWTELAPVDPQLVAAVAGVQQEIVTMKREEADVLHIPSNPNLPSDAYETLINSASEQALINYITEENKYSVMFNNWFDQFDIPFFNEDFIWYPQPIEYPSGDTAIYQYNTATMKWERAAGSLRDAAGNRIPETGPQVNGDGYREYEFVDPSDPQIYEALTNLIDFAGLNGYNVVDTTYGQLSTAGGIYVMTCTETTCTVWLIQ